MAPEPLTIAAAAPLVRSGELTPSALLEQCLARIDVYEPRVKAWAYLDRERARRDAARLTDELKRGQHRGPLHGIPVGIKDIIDVFDMPTGCGSAAWANSYARRDATVVERLRQAGAVVLGKTVTTPFAYLDPPPTRNPWNLDRTPGGSSSGSAAAVACGMVLAALGTQTGGSTTRPASYCGVCSLKPTWGRISVDGVLPLAPSLDHIGVMANCVRDLAEVFEVIAGPDALPRNRATDSIPVPAVDPDADFRETAPQFARLGGVLDSPLTAAMRPLFEAAVAALAGRGGVVEHAAVPVGFADFLAANRAIYATEAALYHADRLVRRPDDYPPSLRALVADGETVPATAYAAGQRLRHELAVSLTRMLGRDRVFLTPATADLAPTPETTGSPAMNSPWSFAGLPTVSVPAGWSPDGLPYAVQLAAGTEREGALFRAAAWCESVLGFAHHLPPVP